VEQEQVQQYIEIIQKLGKNQITGAITFECHWKVWRSG